MRSGTQYDVIMKKNKAAVELGRKGGLARRKSTTREQRAASASKAAKARWAKKDKAQ